MLLVGTEEMRGIDRKCQEMGVPALILMENAGKSLAAQSLRLLLGDLKRRKHGSLPDARISPLTQGAPQANIAVLCGTGQNGGDGFVAARHLSSWGHKVTVVLAGSPDKLPHEAKENLRMLKAYPARIVLGEEFLQTFGGSQDSDSSGPFPDLIIDALLGTGTKGAPRPPLDRLINWANGKRGKCPIVACDIPSGLDADTGFAYEPCVKADLTVTMGLPKIGLYSYPGRMFCGEIAVEDLSMPPAVYQEGFRAQAIFLKDAQRVMPKRQADHHKGKSGHVTVIAGSLGMSGAASLCAEASLRAGAGTATLIVPKDIYQVAGSQYPEVMVVPCDDGPFFAPSPGTLHTVRRFVERSDALALGPGFGRGQSQTDFLKEILPYLSKVPTVIDADGLFALKQLGGLDYLSRLGGEFVLTPHVGEMSRLLDLSREEIGKDRAGVAKRAAAAGKSIVCLKGAGTIVANPSQHMTINTSGTSAMATGGAGDLLTGVIAGLLAQGLRPFESAWLGVFWHGLSGELAEREKGPLGITARDLLEFLPAAGRVISEGILEGDSPFV